MTPADLPPAASGSQPAPQPLTAAVLIIGNEILSGRTQDANLAFLAKALNEVGIRVWEVRVIPDIAQTIIATVNELRPRFDYVFTTGGIGPTHDDITSESVAAAFGVPLHLHPEALARLERRYQLHGHVGPLNEARRRMAHIPEGATLIDNPISAAPGFNIGNVFVLAGVPEIARAMFESLRPGLRNGAKTLSRSVTCGLFEGTIAADLSAIQAEFPALEIGSYPFWSAAGSRVTLVLRGTDSRALDAAVVAVKAMVRRLGGDPLEETLG